MADEAILRIIIEDGESVSMPGEIPPDFTSAEATASDIVVAPSLRVLRSSVDLLVTDLSRASVALRQLPVASPKAITHVPEAEPLPKAITHVPDAAPLPLTPHQKLQELYNEPRAKYSKEEVAEFSPAELAAYHEEQNVYATRLREILEETLTKRELEFLEQAALVGGKYNEVAERMGVKPSRVTALGHQVSEKLGFPVTEILRQGAEENREDFDRQRTPTKRHNNQSIIVENIEATEAPETAALPDNRPPVEILREKLTDRWANEAAKKAPDQEVLAKIVAAMERLESGNVDESIVNAALKKTKGVKGKRSKKADAAVDILAPHLVTGGFFDKGDNPEAFMTEENFLEPEYAYSDESNIPMAEFVSRSATDIGPVQPYGASFEIDHHAEGGPVGHDRLIPLKELVDLVPAKWERPSKSDEQEGVLLADIVRGFRVTDDSFQQNPLPHERYSLYQYLTNNPMAFPEHLMSAGSVDELIEQAEQYVDQAARSRWMDHTDDHHAKGGRIDMSRGGTMPNTGKAESGADWHPAWLTNREYVVNAKSSEHNRGALDAANANPDVKLEAKHYAGGGWVPPAAKVAQDVINQFGWAGSPGGPPAGGGQGPPSPPTPGVVPSAVMSGLAMAAGPVGMAAALAVQVIGAQQKVFQETVVGSVTAIGKFSQAIADPDANPSKIFTGAGAAITEGGKKLSQFMDPIGNALGIDLFPQIKLLTGVVGEAATQFGVLMDAITATAARYGEYSPDIAVAQAMVEIQHVMGDLARAQESGPELARFLRAQGDLQQRIEDAKIRLLTKLVPIVTTIVQVVEAHMPMIELNIDAIALALAPITIVAEGISRLARTQENANQNEAQDPASILFQDAGVLQGQGVGVPQV